MVVAAKLGTMASSLPKAAGELRKDLQGGCDQGCMSRGNAKATVIACD